MSNARLPVSRDSLAAATLARARNGAVLASAVITLGGCMGLGQSHEDKAALAQVEETISRARGSSDVASKSSEYANSVDAALAKQPGLAAKVEQLKTGDTAGKPSEKAVEEALDAKNAAKGEAKSDAVKESAIKETPAKDAAAAVVVAAAHVPAKGESVKPDVKPEAAKTEAKVEAPAAKRDAKIDAASAIIPVASIAAPVEKPQPEVTGRPAAMSNAVAVATIDPTSKAITAMGSMNAAAAAQQVADPASVDAAPAVPEGPSLDAIIAQLRKQVQANPRQLNIALALQLLELDNKDAKTPEAALSALPENDQKIVADLSAAVQSMMQSPATAATAITDRAAPLVAAGRKWETEADLRLPKLALASRVDSYGVYSPVESKFENGKRHTVIIYCEVANFAARKGDDGWYTTKLAQQDSLITEDGLLVWRPNPEEVEDRSRNQRRDFYLVKKLALPETLAIGKYTLRMSVTDKQTNKISMVSIPVEIIGR